MVMVSIGSFGGISPKTPARYLQDSQAQVAINCPVFAGSIQPLPGLGDTGYDATKAGVIQSLYRFGQDETDPTKYWFQWTEDVDVVRGMVAGDTEELTFFTGDGPPRVTDLTLALTGGDEYPMASYVLGIPAPTVAPSVDIQKQNAALDEPAVLRVVSDSITNLEDSAVLRFSVDNETWFTITVATKNATAIKGLIEADAGLLALVTPTVDNGDLVLTSVATGATAVIYIELKTSIEEDTGATPTFLTSALSGTGRSYTRSYMIVSDLEIADIDVGDTIKLNIKAGVAFNQVTTGTFANATAFATWLNNNMATVGGVKPVATAFGSVVKIDNPSAATDDYLEYVRSWSVARPLFQNTSLSSDFVVFGWNLGSATLASFSSLGSVKQLSYKSTASPSSSPGLVVLTQTELDAYSGHYVSVVVNGGQPTYAKVPSGTTIDSLYSLQLNGMAFAKYGYVNPVYLIRTVFSGVGASLSFRAVSFPSTDYFSRYLSSSGVTATSDVPETRVYAYTWVNAWKQESAPSPPSVEVDVYDGQAVVLGSLETVPSGENNLTKRRIYRATAGVYLFVAEIDAGLSTFTDTVKPDDLAEELPSLTWLAPPDTLRGLVAMPNGIMAGFTGRDVYFCDPYHPFAWPIGYNQTVDYPIVGLGVMDTTLAVLTKGTPYFIQGTHPDSMAVVKSDIEQACVSKRSIVSSNGAVLYASPDGLVMLSSSGTKVLTDKLFDYKAWQAYFKPESIHAYQHDMKYVAFYDTGTTQGGFIYDLISGQFILHNLYATAGYNDLRNDTLFLLDTSRNLVTWYGGTTPLTYTWRSKKFTMPQVMGFSCAQIEAESYTLTAKFYADGALIHTQTVTSRLPFRLPPTPGRDWEIQIEGDKEVFKVVMAQSMQEIAGA